MAAGDTSAGNGPKPLTLRGPIRRPRLRTGLAGLARSCMTMLSRRTLLVLLALGLPAAASATPDFWSSCGPAGGSSCCGTPAPSRGPATRRVHARGLCHAAQPQPGGPGAGACHRRGVAARAGAGRPGALQPLVPVPGYGTAAGARGGGAVRAPQLLLRGPRGSRRRRPGRCGSAWRRGAGLET